MKNLVSFKKCPNHYFKFKMVLLGYGLDKQGHNAHTYREMVP